MNIKSIISSFLLLSTATAFSQSIPKLYPYKMDVTKHPDYFRHHVKAPDASLFENKMQFIGLRDLSGSDYAERITQWVDKDKLGNILWVSYPLIYQDNLKEVVGEIKNRNLYLFDLWGYIPGSGPGGYWTQFVIPDGVLDLFNTELGDRWLGMDNGEQDGRYVGSFAPRMFPVGGDRKQQYFNFQRHFEEMGDQLGNKMATLVSLNFGHYFLKEGVYTLIGAETAQGLPNSQIYYSFIRGAGKQYGVNWFGNASVWNRWGWKTYDPKQIKYDENDYGAGNPLKGTSLSLLKRLMYTHLFYNCVAAGFEGSMYVDGKKLSPIGKIQQEAVKWSERHGDAGVMYTPVALMVDFFSGWSFPRHLYSKDAYKVWGNLPYEKGDYMTDNMLNIIYPGYQDASYYHDEKGFIASTPYGDITDCLMSDAPLWILKQYPMLVIADELRSGMEIKDKLEAYVESGGHLVITSSSLKNMPEGIGGISSDGITGTVSLPITYKDKQISEKTSFALSKLSLPKEAEILQKAGNDIAAARINYGKGTLTVIASPYGIGEVSQCELPVKIKEDSPLPTPYPMLNHVQALMEDMFSSLELFDTDPNLSIVTCVRSDNEYTVLITNNDWEPRPFSIKAKQGSISSMEELVINQDEIKALGYTPKVVQTPSGRNSKDMIAGGSVRAFRIKTKGMPVSIMEEVTTVPNVTGRSLTLRNIKNLKEEILVRPTFFEHYDGVVIDWRYIEDKEEATLRNEAGWLGRQKLNITVDLTSGLNLYPDLRIVDNDEHYYEKSMARIKKIIDKLSVIGAQQLVLSSQRSIENNYTMEQFNKSLVESLQKLADYASDKDITILFRPSYRRVADKTPEAIEIVKKANRKNLILSPSMSLLLNDEKSLDQAINELKSTDVKVIFVAASSRDIHNQIYDMNTPISKCSQQKDVKKIIEAFPKAKIIMDANYASQDEEYLDTKMLDMLK